MIFAILFFAGFVLLCWRAYAAHLREERKIWLAELATELPNGFVRITSDKEETIPGRFVRRTVKAEFGLLSKLTFECLTYDDGVRDLLLRCESRYRCCRIEENDVPKDDIGTPLLRHWLKTQELADARKRPSIAQS
jgi:hypothetical protein